MHGVGIFLRVVVVVASAAGASACGDDAPDDVDAGGALGARDDTPPMGAAEIEAWLKTGVYKSWACESEPHLARAPSPHGYNRICSNDLIAQYVDGDSPWPRGAAAVKELYASADQSEPVGYAVYLKTEADSADGANWYWYERVSLDSDAPHEDDGVVADGMGDSGLAKSVCVSCHAAAGSDAAHTPSVGGRDQVYTPVM